MIRSMTTFVNVQDQDESILATWEIRSLNHRYFECSLKLPDIFRHLDTTIRQTLQQQLIRGKIECSLKITPHADAANDFNLNQTLLNRLLTALDGLRTHTELAKVDPLRLLAWPDLLQTTTIDPAQSQPLVEQLFAKALGEALSTREREGARTALFIQERLQQILAIAAQIETQIPTIITHQKEKFHQQLAEVNIKFDQSRLEQEIVYFMQKIDVAEELNRLTTHAQEVSKMLETSEAVGKKLDFLMQELNREANTLASKSSNIQTTQLALELKVLIEQIREQVQNIV